MPPSVGQRPLVPGGTARRPHEIKRPAFLGGRAAEAGFLRVWALGHGRASWRQASGGTPDTGDLYSRNALATGLSPDCCDPFVNKLGLTQKENAV